VGDRDRRREAARRRRRSRRAHRPGSRRAGTGPRSSADGAGDYGLLALLQLWAHVDLPLVASGAIASGGALAAVLCAGAQAAQIGTAFMRCPEAGTSPAHRAALVATTPTRLTRAFTGRQARGIVNRFLREHSADAPLAYPEIHHVTAPLRAAARAADDPDAINLWAGQAHELASDAPAANVVAALAAEAREPGGAAGRCRRSLNPGPADAPALRASSILAARGRLHGVSPRRRTPPRPPTSKRSARARSARGARRAQRQVPPGCSVGSRSRRASRARRDARGAAQSRQDTSEVPALGFSRSQKHVEVQVGERSPGRSTATPPSPRGPASDRRERPRALG
jgi:hypothetical protein